MSQRIESGGGIPWVGGQRPHAHLVGIGGIGMSALAVLLAARGWRVTGSDLKPPTGTGALARLGIKVWKGHRSEYLTSDRADRVIYSSAVNPQNPELLEARRQGSVVQHRSELLAELFNPERGIAVAGMHGKTTTTALIALILQKNGFDPTAVVGGWMRNYGTNILTGSGPWVIEADESDGSFLNYRPRIAVITNIEWEHVDFFKDMVAVHEAFRRFVSQIVDGGALVACGDDPELSNLLQGLDRPSIRVLTYGLTSSCVLRAEKLVPTEWSTRFTVVRNSQTLGTVDLPLPGQHNVANALAAIGAAIELQIPFEQCQRALAAYQGTERRCQMRVTGSGVVLVNDYAHHPTEVRSTIAALRPKGRLIGVFQPHRYTRFQQMMDEFAGSFDGTDELYLMDIYAASEPALEGVHTRSLVSKMQEREPKPPRVHYEADAEAVFRKLMADVRTDDTILIMGAGDVGTLFERLSFALQGIPALR